MIDDATVPIGVWIGPSGANARGASALLALLAPVRFASRGRAGIGPVYPVRFDETGTPPREEVAERVARRADGNGRSTDASTTS